MSKTTVTHVSIQEGGVIRVYRVDLGHYHEYPATARRIAAVRAACKPHRLTHERSDSSRAYVYSFDIGFRLDGRAAYTTVRIPRRSLRDAVEYVRGLYPGARVTYGHYICRHSR